MRRPAVLLALAAGFAAPSRAHAHLLSTGFGPFYDGLAHLFVTPQELLPVVALALLAGLHGPRFGRAVLFALPAAWLTGSVIGLLVAQQMTSPVAEAVLTIALGGMVAAGAALPLPLVVGFAVALGLLAGGVNGIELATARASPLGAAGVTTALFVLVSLLAGQVTAIRALWVRVAVRVAGSWIAAIGLLMLGWSFRR